MDERKKRALEAAQACARLLRERFGAKRVILFGSLAGQGPWHERSDIDLAVEGLAGEDFFAAYAACGELLPPGVELDLVPLENTYPEMRARIMEAAKMHSNFRPTLKGLIEDELTSLERVVRRMDELLAKRAYQPTWVEMHAMASLLHGFYTGVESIFHRIAVWLGEGLPKGAHWHVDLLDQMTEEREGI